MKLLHFSDNHQDFGRLEAILAHAKSVKADCIVGSGDFFDDQASVIKIPAPKIDERILEKIATKKQEKKQLTPDEEKQFNTYAEYIQKINKKVADDATEVYRAYNTRFAHYAIPVLVVEGNHDIGPIIRKELSTATFLNRQSKTIKGITFGGLNHTFELTPAQINPQLSEGVQDDIQAQALAQHANQEGRSLEEVTQEYLGSHERYQQLLTEKPHVLVYHNPPHIGKLDVLEDGKNRCNSGVAGYTLAKQLKVPVLCGHIHKGLRQTIEGITGIRAAPDIAYEIDMDERTKKITMLTVYRVIPLAAENVQKQKAA